ncbi:MAG: MerR family transcriptional regulator [Neptuniibacter sp.]
MYSIKVIAEESGIKPATLRKWEERYGFPMPVRNPNGARSYTERDLEQLKSVKTMIDRGLRPSAIFSNKLIDTKPVKSDKTFSAEVEKVYSLSKAGLFEESLELLKSFQNSLSTLEFVETICAPLAVKVGEGWAEGDIPVYIEHAISEQIHAVLTIDQSCFYDTDAPLALLCTLSNEHHTLGLKMANAILNDAGCRTIYLGAGLPVSEIVDAVESFKPEYVGISITTNTSPRIITKQIDLLRSKLPANITILLGGSGCSYLNKLPEGSEVLSDLYKVYELF